MPEGLLDRIGGKAAVNAAVDIFYRRIMRDSSIRHFFKDTDMGRQMIKQKAFLIFVFGGDLPYTGEDLRAAHKHLDIKEEDFLAVAGHLRATLQELKVKPDIIKEVDEIIAKFHDDILDL